MLPDPGMKNGSVRIFAVGKSVRARGNPRRLFSDRFRTLFSSSTAFFSLKKQVDRLGGQSLIWRFQAEGKKASPVSGLKAPKCHPPAGEFGVFQFRHPFSDELPRARAGKKTPGFPARAGARFRTLFRTPFRTRFRTSRQPSLETRQRLLSGSSAAPASPQPSAALVSRVVGRPLFDPSFRPWRHFLASQPDSAAEARF